MKVAACSGFLGCREDWDPFFAALGGAFRRVEPGEPCEVRIGYSMGGREALAAADRSTRALVLVSSSPGIEDDALRGDRAGADEALAAQVAAGVDEAFLRAWWAQPVFASHRWSEQHWAALIESRRTADGPAAARALRRRGQGQSSLWKTLEGLRCPVLAATGALDPKYEALGAEIARRARSGTHVSIPECGHMVHLEQPHSLAAAVAQFLATLPDCPA